jgi:hypothetical protein
MTTPAPGDLINGWRVAELDKMQKRASVRCSSCGFTLFASVEALVDASLRRCDCAKRPGAHSGDPASPFAHDAAWPAGHVKGSAIVVCIASVQRTRSRRWLIPHPERGRGVQAMIEGRHPSRQQSPQARSSSVSRRRSGFGWHSTPSGGTPANPGAEVIEDVFEASVSSKVSEQSDALRLIETTGSWSFAESAARSAEALHLNPVKPRQLAG